MIEDAPAADAIAGRAAHCPRWLWRLRALLREQHSLTSRIRQARGPALKIAAIQQ